MGAFIHDSSNYHLITHRPPSPFLCPLLRVSLVLWLGLTPVNSAIPYDIVYSLPKASSTGLPGYSHALSLHLPAAFTENGSVQLLGFGLFGSLTPVFSLYAISVRQTRDLPPASFRFPVARDTLALSYTFPTAGQVRDFHPLVACARRAHQKSGTAFAVPLSYDLYAITKAKISFCACDTG